MGNCCCCKDGRKKDQNERKIDYSPSDEKTSISNESANENIIQKRFLREFVEGSFRAKKGEIVKVIGETPSKLRVEKYDGRKTYVSRDDLEDVQLHSEEEQDNVESDSHEESSSEDTRPPVRSQRLFAGETREHPTQPKSGFKKLKRKSFKRDWQDASFRAKKGQVAEVLKETTNQSFVQIKDGRRAYVPNRDLEDIDSYDEEEAERTEDSMDTPTSSKDVKYKPGQYEKRPTTDEQLLSVEQFDSQTFIVERTFNPIRDEEIPVKEGERLIRIKEGELSWKMKSQNDPSKVGLVPSSMLRPVTFQDEPWYFGKMDNVRSCKLLLGKDIPEGTFLVRDSATQKDNVTLSVRVTTKDCKLDVLHFRVSVSKTKTAESMRYKIKSQATLTECSSSQELILHHNKNHLVTTNGLVVPLKYALINPVKDDVDFPCLADIKINPSQIQKQDTLGEGNFGKVFKATWTRKEGKVTVAVKESKTTDKREGIEEMKKEAEAMSKLRHINIVSLFGYCYCKSEESVMLVFEFVSQGDLRNYLRKAGYRAINLTDVDILYYALQVANGMKYLASENIVHRDLSARNVLLGENHVVKIADFGLARLLSTEKIYTVQTAKRELPTKWIAPEALKEGIFNEKSDVWSYGIFLTELVTKGGNPYPDIKEPQLLLIRLDQGWRMQQEQLECSDDIYRVMRSCWSRDPLDRPNFETLFETVNALYMDTMAVDYPGYLSQWSDHS